MLALEGIKVLDLTRGGPGPFHTFVLGDLGAEVIRVEAPLTAGAKQAGIQSLVAGEEGRRTTLYYALHRNKKSIAINLRSEKGRKIFYKMAETADVISEGFRPGVTQRLKIDYDTMSKINPRIIYCSITGYGPDGPYSQLPGHDINYLSFAGALDLIGNKGDKPAVPLNLVADFGAGGMYAAIGVLSAIVARSKTGRGQFVDIALTDGVISLLTHAAGNYFRTNVLSKRGETSTGGGYPYYAVYETKDRKYITIGCIEPWFWENLCKVIGREDLIPFHYESDHFIYSPEGKQWEEISSFLKKLFLTKTRDEWFELLSAKDVTVGKVLSFDEVFADPQVLHRNMLVELEDPTEGKIKQVGIAVKLSDTPGKVRSLPPMIGEHTDAILSGMGYSKQEIGELRKEEVIG